MFSTSFSHKELEIFLSIFSSYHILARTASYNTEHHMHITSIFTHDVGVKLSKVK